MGYPKIIGLFHGKSHEKWMMTGGTPISGNLQMDLEGLGMFSGDF